MATSSIFANFDITDPQKARAFIAAIEKSANIQPVQRSQKKTLVTDRRRIKALFKDFPMEK